MTETSNCYFPCDRCKKNYACINCSGPSKCNSKQAHDCAACVRLQKDWGKDYFGGLDCPPRNDVIAADTYYIQAFYGSHYDSTYFAFSGNKNAQQIRNEHEWIKENTRIEICDDCIANLLRKKNIVVANSDDSVYPCYCNVCNRLFEEQRDSVGPFAKDISECNTTGFQLPSGEWAFCQSWESIVKFSSLKDFEMPKNGRICDLCFAQLISIHGKPIPVTQKEIYPKFYDNKELE